MGARAPERRRTSLWVSLTPSCHPFAAEIHDQQANEVCVAERNVNADFVYFGCGLRLLQLVPDRPEQPTPLDT